MAGGILGILPQAADGGGILGNFNTLATDNRAALLGLGAGLLSGQGWGAGAQGYMQGMQQDQRTRLLQQAQAEKVQKQQALRDAATKLGIDPNIARASPETFAAVAAKKLIPRDLTFQERLFNALPVDQRPAAQAALLGLNKNPVEWKQGTNENPDGTKTSFFYNPRDPSQTMMAPGGQGQSQANPYALVGNGTAEQNNAAMFANRAAQAHEILNDKEGALLSQWDATKSMAPDWAGKNRIISADKRQADQAKVNFLTAVLRKESGASISPTEFENGEKTYFPQPGDDPQTIENKRQARIAAVEGLMGSAGRGYHIPKGWEDPSRAGQRATKTTQETAKAVGAVGGKGLPSGSYNYVPGKGLVPAQ